MLCVQLGRGGDPIEKKGHPGRNTWLTGIRHWTGAFCGAGDCVSLFALLTPLGSVQLLGKSPARAGTAHPRERRRASRRPADAPARKRHRDGAHARSPPAGVRCLARKARARASAARCGRAAGRARRDAAVRRARRGGRDAGGRTARFATPAGARLQAVDRHVAAAPFAGRPRPGRVAQGAGGCHAGRHRRRRRLCRPGTHVARRTQAHRLDAAALHAGCAARSAGYSVRTPVGKPSTSDRRAAGGIG